MDDKLSHIYIYIKSQKLKFDNKIYNSIKSKIINEYNKFGFICIYYLKTRFNVFISTTIFKKQKLIIAGHNFPTDLIFQLRETLDNKFEHLKKYYYKF